MTMTSTELNDMEVLTRIKESINRGLEHVVNLRSHRMSYMYFKNLIHNIFSKLGIKVRITPIRSNVGGRKIITRAKVMPVL